MCKNEQSKSRKSLFIGVMIGCFLSGAILSYAITNFIFNGSFRVPNPKKPIFTADLTGQVEAVPLASGEEQSIAPTLKNTGNTRMYVFIRINTTTTEDDKSVYSFTPSSSNWILVETGQADEMVYAYGDPTALRPGESATLSGKMRVDVDNLTYSELDEDALHYTVTGCAIGTDAESSGAAALYNEYLSSGGR